MNTCPVISPRCGWLSLEAEEKYLGCFVACVNCDIIVPAHENKYHCYLVELVQLKPEALAKIEGLLSFCLLQLTEEKLAMFLPVENRKRIFPLLRTTEYDPEINGSRRYWDESIELFKKSLSARNIFCW